jgi:hypothetical protein
MIIELSGEAELGDVGLKMLHAISLGYCVRINDAQDIEWHQVRYTIEGPILDYCEWDERSGIGSGDLKHMKQIDIEKVYVY